jgi:hypothetical protein
MPHPEHAVDPLLGPTGGRALFASVLTSHHPVGAGAEPGPQERAADRAAVGLPAGQSAE